METVVTSVLALVVTLGLLIAFHEYGHYWAARRMGVKVLRFSIGFGKPLWLKRYGPDQTEYAIAAIPLGGYVKMLDEREATVDESELHRAFNRQPVAKRIFIVAAGPIFNFIFAIVAYFLMFIIGIPGMKPIVGDIAADTIAAQSGLRSNDQIVAVGGRITPTWSATRLALLEQALDQDELEIEVATAEGARRFVLLDATGISTEEKQSRLLEELGIVAFSPTIPARIGRVQEGSPAAKAGLRLGDEVMSVDEQAVKDWQALVATIQASPLKRLKLGLIRDGASISIDVIPDQVDSKAGSIGRIGAAPDVADDFFEDLRSEERFPVGAAVIEAIKKTWQMSWLTLKMIGKMLVGEVSVKNLSGPITIATYAGYTASIGVAVFLSFLAVVSISLGVLNLLPIPLLDGGHLLMYGIEIVKGSEVSEDIQGRMQQVGIVLLAMLMVLAFYNDLRRLFGE